MFDPEDSVAPSDTSSQDASKPGFQQAWNAWTSKPENNAALLQFGISMLQPRAPGQSGIGSVANSIGDAAGASTRVQEAQRAEELQAANIADKEANRENQASLAASKNIEANAYDYAARNKTPAVGGLSGVLRVQQDFRKWLAKPEDTTGMSVDPIVGAIAKKFPNVKTKADLLSDPAAYAAAQRLFQTQMTTEPSDTGQDLGAEAPAGAGAPPSAPIVAHDKSGKLWTKDPTDGQFKDAQGKVYKP